MNKRKDAKNKNLSPEEKYQRALKAKRKFRAIVRLIIANLTWLNELEDDRLGDNVKKNIAVLTRKKGKKSLLTLAEKATLNKPKHARTEDEKAHLRKLLMKLKCFKHYPPAVKYELPAVMFFAYFGANRTILKQDYEPLNFYVILSGEVVVSEMVYDNMLKEDISRDVCVMASGECFGEVALLKDTNRWATVTTSEASEFLYIKREDFDSILKESMLKFWGELQTYLSWFNYFDGWNEKFITEACIHAKKKSFQPDQIILGDGMGYSDYIYFLVCGTCYVIEPLPIKTITKQGRKYYELDESEKFVSKPPASTLKDLKKMFRKESMSAVKIQTSVHYNLKHEKIETDDTKIHFLKICTFNKMACFNVGENLKNRYIVAALDSDCLMLPKTFLMDKSRTIYKQIEHFLNTHIPNTQKLFKSFIEEIRWRQYKIRMVKELIHGKNLQNQNNIHNVPYSIRLGEDMGEI